MTQTRPNETQHKALRRFRLPFGIRLLSTVLLPIFVWSSLPLACRAAVEIQLEKPAPRPSPLSPPSRSTAKSKPDLKPPALPANLAAKKEPEPQPTTAPVTFSKQPTDQELFDYGLLAEPLVPTDDKSEPK